MHAWIFSKGDCIKYELFLNIVLHIKSLSLSWCISCKNFIFQICLLVLLQKWFNIWNPADFQINTQLFQNSSNILLLGSYLFWAAVIWQFKWQHAIIGVIRMSHWCCQATEGTIFWISCKWLKSLRKAGHLQLIQNSAPSAARGCQCGIKIAWGKY